VLSYHELKGGHRQEDHSDVSLIPMYEEIKNHKFAIEQVRLLARQWAAEAHAAKKSGKARKNQITAGDAQASPFVCSRRKRRPRAIRSVRTTAASVYFHEIAQPDKITRA